MGNIRPVCEAKYADKRRSKHVRGSGVNIFKIDELSFMIYKRVVRPTMVYTLIFGVLVGRPAPPISPTMAYHGESRVFVHVCLAVFANLHFRSSRIDYLWFSRCTVNFLSAESALLPIGTRLDKLTHKISSVSELH